MRGMGDLIPSVVGGGDDGCGAAFAGGVSFAGGASFTGGASFAGVSFACSGQTNSDFGGTAPTFLYQHFRPSISRQDNQPDSDFGVLRHSIAACADEVTTQQQTNTVATSFFITGTR